MARTTKEKKFTKADYFITTYDDTKRGVVYDNNANPKDLIAFYQYDNIPEYSKSKDTEKFLKDIHEAFNRLRRNAVVIEVTIEFLKTLIGDKTLKINKSFIEKNGERDMKSQRKYVWNEEQKSRFIISVINGSPIIPTANILIDENEQILLTIDGIQRLYTIISFLENKFKITRTETKLDGFYYSDMPIECRYILLDHPVQISVVHSSYARYFEHYFEILNNTQIKLSKGEKINSYLYKEAKDAYSVITKAASNEYVKKAFGFSENDIRDDAFATFVQTTAMIYLLEDHGFKNAGPVMLTKEFAATKDVQTCCPDIVNYYTQVVPETCKKMVSFFGERFCFSITNDIGIEIESNCFPKGYIPYGRTGTKVISTHVIPVFYIIRKYFDQFDDMSGNERKEIAKIIDTIFASEEFTSKEHADSRNNIIKKIEFVESKISHIVNKYKE